MPPLVPATAISVPSGETFQTQDGATGIWAVLLVVEREPSELIVKLASWVVRFASVDWKAATRWFVVSVPTTAEFTVEAGSPLITGPVEGSESDPSGRRLAKVTFIDCVVSFVPYKNVSFPENDP